MCHSVLSICSFETKITPGSYFHLKTDWFESDKEIKTIIIDQDNTYTKLLSIYPNDFYMYLEQNQDCSIYRTNHPLYLEANLDYYQVDWTH